MSRSGQRRCCPAASSGTDPTSVFRLVDRVTRRLRALHRLSMDRAGLPPSGLAILQALWAQDHQSPAALAVHAGCTRATMTSLLDSLEKRALVQRQPHPQDRRSLQIALTPKGKDIRKRTPDLGQVFDCCCSGLSPEEFTELFRLLQKLEHSLAPQTATCHSQETP